MLKKINKVNRIVANITVLRQYISSMSKIGLQDINQFSESFVGNLLNIIYDFSLVNLNIENHNFPGIDLADKKNRIAFQITSNSKSNKIIETIDTCIKNDYFAKYDIIKVFITTYKQKKYSSKYFTNMSVNFNTKNDIIDFDDIFLAIKELELKKIDKLDMFINSELNKRIRFNQYCISGNGYLIFKNIESLVEWKTEVNFALGYPKYPRNALTKEFYYNKSEESIKYSYGESFDKSDKRKYTLFNDKIPQNLLDENAQKKYNFRETSIEELEDMGFYYESIITNDELTNNFDLPPIEFLRSKKNYYEVGVFSTQALTFMAQIKFCPDNSPRNKYFLDLGSNNTNRFSVFLNINNRLCFRLIDNNHRSYLFISNQSINSEYFDELLYLRFDVNFKKDLTYFIISLNNIQLINVKFNDQIDYKLTEKINGVIGSNIEHQYGCKFHLYKLTYIHTRFEIWKKVKDYKKVLHSRYLININASDLGTMWTTRENGIARMINSKKINDLPVT